MGDQCIERTFVIFFTSSIPRTGSMITGPVPLTMSNGNVHPAERGVRMSLNRITPSGWNASHGCKRDLHGEVHRLRCARGTSGASCTAPGRSSCTGPPGASSCGRGRRRGARGGRGRGRRRRQRASIETPRTRSERGRRRWVLSDSRAKEMEDGFRMLTPAGTRDGDGGRRDRAHQIGGRSTSSPRIARSISGSVARAVLRGVRGRVHLDRPRARVPRSRRLRHQRPGGLDGVESTLLRGRRRTRTRGRGTRAALRARHGRSAMRATMCDVPYRAK